MNTLKKSMKSNYLVLIIILILAGNLCFSFSPLIGRFADCSSRTADSIQYASLSGFKELLTSKYHLFEKLHLPLDTPIRAFINFIFSVFDLSNLSLVKLQNLLTSVMYITSIFILLAYLSIKISYKVILLLSFFILSSICALEALAFSLTENIAFFFIALSIFNLKNRLCGLFLLIGSMIRPECILFIPLLSFFHYSETKSYKQLMLLLVVSSSYFLGKDILKYYFYDSHQNYLNFSTLYHLPDYPILNTIEKLFLQESIPMNIGLETSVIILLLSFFAILRNYKSNMKESNLIILSVGYCLFILIGYKFNIGRPELRNFIYPLTIILVTFVAIFDKLNSKKQFFIISLVGILFSFNFSNNLDKLQKKNEFQKKINPHIMEIADIIRGDSVGVDFLQFNEWLLRALIVSPINHEKICSFERVPELVAEYPFNISKSYLELANKSPRHFRYTKQLNNFIQSEKPIWIVSLNKKEFIKFFNRHKKNIPHISVVHHHSLNIKDGSKLIFNKLTYKIEKEIGPFVLFKKAAG